MINGPDIYTEDFSEQPIATGDLFFPVKTFGEDNCGGVVLTPLCDLAQEKTTWVKLAKAIPLRDYLVKEFIPAQFKGYPEFKTQVAEDPATFGNRFLEDKNSRVNKDVLGLVKNLKKVIENISPLKASHYYLPGKDNPAKGYLADFSHISSVPINELADQTPVSRLKSPWREQFLNRYIGFSLRIGTDNYSEACVLETLHSFF